MRGNYFNAWMAKKMDTKNIPVIRQILTLGLLDTDEHYSFFYDYLVSSIANLDVISSSQLIDMTKYVLEHSQVSYDLIYLVIFTTAIPLCPDKEVSQLVKYLMVLYGDAHVYMQNQIEREGWL